MPRMIAALLLSLSFASSALAQEAMAPDASTVGANPASQTLEDILRRQEGLNVTDADRAAEIGETANAQGETGQLGTLGGASDADLWRAYRFGEADISTQNRGPAARTLMQDGGMWWLDYRRGPLQDIAAYLLGGTLLALVVFFLLRGRIRIHGEKTGRTQISRYLCGRV